MEIILIIIVGIVSALLVWLNLPGTFLMTGFLFLWAWVTGFETFTIGHAVALLVMMLVLEGIEFGLGSLTTRLYGGTPGSSLWAIVGGLLGTFIGAGMFLLFGALVGMLVGSYTGVYISELAAGRPRPMAARAALGALVGNVAAKMMKSGAVIITLIWMIASLPE